MDSPVIAINTASAEQIATLYGIGPGLAVRVVESREAEGFFTAPEDLARVKGISNRLAGVLAPHIDWSLPQAGDPSGFRDHTGAVKWLLLAAAWVIVSWPLIGAIQEVIGLRREGINPTLQQLTVIGGRSGGQASAVLGILLRALYALDTRRRLIRKASNLLFVLAAILLLPAIALIIWTDLRSASYRTDAQAPMRLFAFSAGAMALIPQLLAWRRPSFIGRRFLTYWVNSIFLLLMLALLLREYQATDSSTLRIGIALLAVVLVAMMSRGFLHGTLPLQPAARASQGTQDPRVEERTDATTRARTGQRWPWLSWPGWAGLQGLTSAAALLVALLGLVSDPLGVARGSSELPRLVGEIEPSRDWYEWFRFFESNESSQVYLDLNFQLQEDLDATGLLPAKRTRPRSLRIRACEPPIEDACTEVTITVLADPEVEEHVFFSGADPDGRIKGHFIVDSYFTQMSLVEISLKPLSISSVENPYVPRADE